MKIVGIAEIVHHFQAGQQFDIACEAAGRRLDGAVPFIGGGKLRPGLSEVPKGRSFVLGAAVDFDGRSAFEAAEVKTP